MATTRVTEPRTWDIIKAGVARSDERTRRKLANGQLTRVQAACLGWHRQAQIYCSLQWDHPRGRRKVLDDSHWLVQAENTALGYWNTLDLLIPDEQWLR